jgi:hypothetical protein
MTSGSLLIGSTFLMADDQHFVPAQFRETRQHRPVVTKKFVPMQLDEFVERKVQIVLGVWPVFVTRNLNNLPRRKIGVDASRRLGPLATQLSHLLLLGFGMTIVLLKSPQLDLNVQNRLLKLKSRGCCFHSLRYRLASFSVW